MLIIYTLTLALCYAPDARAASICKDSAGNDVQGFTVALAFCIRSTITDALTGSHITNIIPSTSTGYLTQIIQFLNPYKWAAITLAFTLYGVKLMTVSVEKLLEESATLLFKTAFVLFLIDNLGAAGQTLIYSSQAGNGLYGLAVDFAGELVSFVSTGFAGVMNGCTPPPLPVGANPVEYIPWQAFDCLFNQMLGGAASSTYAASVIMLVIVAALFTGTLGIYVLIGALTLFIMALLILMRAVYTVLLSYFVLALLIAIGPLIVPILIFDSKFTKEIFWKWISLIFNTMLQPLFIVGFLSFFLMVDFQFIGGTFPGCNITGQNYQTNTGGMGDPNNLLRI